MFKTIGTIITLFISMAISMTTLAAPQIIGGENAVENEFPWLAQIRLRTEPDLRLNHQCGGALITRNIIVTAAHCLSGENISITNLQVVLGEHQRSRRTGNEQVFNIRSAHIHSQYVPSTLNYDIGVIILDGNATLIPGIVELAELSSPSEHNDITIMGWGLTRDLTHFAPAVSNILKKGTTKILSQRECVPLKQRHGFGSQHFCAESTSASTCFADSGCPAMRPGTNQIVGIVSGGDPYCIENYGFYTSLSNTRFWLKGWIDYQKKSHAASITCHPAGRNATRCTYQGYNFNRMDFNWSSSQSNFRIVYPSSGSFPYNTKNGAIVFIHPNSNQCPRNTRISLETRFHGLRLGSATFTCR